MINGILLVNKPSGLTSRDVVNDVCLKFNTKKVGHTGTLDPLASGVLVLCVGEATKVVDLLTSLEKEYIAEVKLGLETDTLDITGTTLKTQDVSVTKQAVIEVLNSFIGTYQQQVPIYSAVKVNGKKLYEYARKGEEIDLPKRDVTIKKIELLDDLYYQDNNLCFRFKCIVSKGTYIRSLIKDICDKLGVIGVMSELIRTKQGPFTIEDCLKIDEASEKDLKPIQDVLDIPKIVVNDYLKNKIMNGQILDNRYNTEKIMFIYRDHLLAIYQVYDKDKSKVKPYRVFGGRK